MAILASDLVKRKKEQVYVEGYQINCASDASGGAAATEDVIHVYGKDDPLLDVRVDNGTLSLTVYDKKDNNQILDALTENDPDYSDTEDTGYNWDNIASATTWINRLNKDNSEYERSIFYKNWLPVPGMSGGAPEARNTRTFAGNCEIPEEYNQPILGEKLALSSGAGGYTATLAKQTPREVPGTLKSGADTYTAPNYALRVMAIYEGRKGNEVVRFEKEDLDIDNEMVDSAGNITIAQSDLSSVTWPNAIYVNYLFSSGQGIYPTSDCTPQGMYEKLSLEY